jgi:hypothetical protein
MRFDIAMSVLIGPCMQDESPGRQFLIGKGHGVVTIKDDHWVIDAEYSCLGRITGL